MAEVWCLLISHNRKPVGRLFKVAPGDDVADLKQRVKEKGSDRLKGVGVSEFIVWRCTDATSFDDEDHEVLATEVSKVFAEKKVTQLGGRRTIAGLNILKEETLLIEVPGDDSGSDGMILGKRKPASGYKYGDNLNERKLAKLAPSTVNNASKYSKLQEDEDEKIFDDRPTRDQIPPLPLLYHGFGRLHDTMDAWTQSSECHVALQDNVDELIDSMCGLSSEQRKQDNAHEILVRILSPASQKTFRFGVEEHSFTGKTNGHILAPHGGPSFIAEFKTSLGVAEVQLANYFILLAGKVDKDIFLGWRLPALGLLIRGPTISFHGLLMVDKQVRCVPLTDIFVCNDRDVIRNREPLYAAFHAATVLLDSINDDAKMYFTSRPAAIPDYQRRFPDIRSLCSVEDVEGPGQQNRTYFQIVQSLADATTERLLYVANKQDFNGKMDGTTIIVKFSKKYGKEVHLFCANKGFAPQLLGFETLPGGWYAIAMEHFSSASTIIDSPLFRDLEETWVERMKFIVKELHDNGYVHGDLRLPNFIVDGERLLLVDFDWRGKSGEATFPNTRLRPILRSNRRETLITRERDEEVLGNTIGNMKGSCA